MKKLLCTLALVSIVGFGILGCEEAAGPAGGGSITPETSLTAGQIQSDVPPIEPAQMQCYVCGKPIKAEFYVDFNGKRAYCDSKECADTFKKDPEKYLKQWGIPESMWR